MSDKRKPQKEKKAHTDERSVKAEKPKVETPKPSAVPQQKPNKQNNAPTGKINKGSRKP